MHNAMLRALLCCCFMGAMGCSPGASTAEETAPGDDVQEPPAAMYTPPELSSVLPDLRMDHRVSGEGDACGFDGDCESPLRCLEEECGFPAGMTGQADERTPWVRLVTDSAVTDYFVELARTPAEQARGLMHRNVMRPEFGMLFIFNGDGPRSFWMRNTWISLDIIYIRSDGMVVSIIHEAEPLSEVSRPSEGPAMFVLEVLGGDAERVRLEPGDFVQIVIPDDAAH